MPCSTTTGGVIILASNAILFVDQSGRRVILPVNGWPPRVSDLAVPSLSPQEQTRDLELEGSRVALIDDKRLLLILKDGTVYPIELIQDGRTVSKLSMSSALARTTMPSVAKRVGDNHIFVASVVGPSVLLRAAKVEEKILEADIEVVDGPTAVVDTSNVLDMMDADDGKPLQCASAI